jgi:hypothetical protein
MVRCFRLLILGYRWLAAEIGGLRTISSLWAVGGSASPKTMVKNLPGGQIIDGKAASISPTR